MVLLPGQHLLVLRHSTSTGHEGAAGCLHGPQGGVVQVTRAGQERDQPEGWCARVGTDGDVAYGLYDSNEGAESLSWEIGGHC